MDVLRPVTETHPGLIETTLENATGGRRTVTSPGRWPFGSHVGLDPDGSRIERMAEEAYGPGFVTDSGTVGSWIASFRTYANQARRLGRHRFEAAARITVRYPVLGDHDADGDGEAGSDGDGEAPLTAGRYTFRKGYADDDVEFPWGFRLTLRNPEA